MATVDRGRLRACNTPRQRGVLWRLATVLVVLLVWALPAPAHDMPSEMRAHVFAKVDGERLHVMLRLPLALLMNIDLPKQGPGYLALAQIDEGLARAVGAADKDIVWFANKRRLMLARSTARISPPSDASFGNFDSASALVHGPRLPDTAYVFWNQGYFDAHLEYGIDSADVALAIDFRVAPALRDRLRVDLRYVLPDGVERAFDLPTAQGQIVLDPRWYQAAWTFVQSGFEHILEGTDHLLFVLCLVLPFRRVDGYLVGVVSAFTVAHSVTLIAAAYGLAPAADWFAPLIETLIALSILFMAVENVLQAKPQRRWLVSGLFGLVHGFGFAFALQTQLQFAGSNLLLSLLAFNVGVELGQLAVLVVLLVVFGAWRRLRPGADRAIVIVVCALAGHVAWHWMFERGQSLLAHLPSDWNPQAVLGGALSIGVLLWAVQRMLQRRRKLIGRLDPVAADD